MRAWQILRALVPACFGADRGQKLKAALLRLGGPFPKLGQQASFRRDWYPADVCDALASLQSEKGHGTIGYVVFVGTLAVKRSHEGREAEVRRDLRILGWCGAVCRWVPVLRRLQLQDLAREGQAMFDQAFDHRYEGAFTRKLAPELAKFGIRSPRVISATRNELITERVFGETATDLARRRSTVDARTMQRHAERAIDALLYCIHELNLFPYDLHEGNMMIDGRGRLWWIDVTVTSIDDGFLRPFTRFIYCLAQRDWSWAAGQFLRLQLRGKPLLTRVRCVVTYGRLSQRLARVLSAWAQDVNVNALPFDRRALNTAVQRMVFVLVRAGVSLTWEWLPIQQAWMTLESFVKRWWPRVNYLRVSERYIDDFKRRNPKSWKDRLTDLADMADQHLDFMTDAGLISALLQGR